VVPRQDLLQDVWKFKCAARTRTIDFHIRSLRRKLEDRPERPRYILTHRKFGYRLNLQDEVPESTVSGAALPGD
jgi:two-component system alkaline phosphatase synthesis response regulator PhoP